MDWKKTYEDRIIPSRLRRPMFQYVVHIRIKRFKENKPSNDTHLSELMYLIANHDDELILFRKYHDIVPGEVKDNWLKKRVEDSNGKNLTTNRILTETLLPFYLVNPDHKNELIQKDNLNNHLFSVLSNLDHVYKTNRVEACRILTFLNFNFSAQPPTIREKVAEVLMLKVNRENVTQATSFILKFSTFLKIETYNYYVDKILSNDLVGLRLAIGILKNKSELISQNKDRLMKLVYASPNANAIIKDLL